MSENAMMTTKELRDLVGRNRLGRDAALSMMRKHGTKVGRRWLISRRKVAELLGLPENL